MKWRDFGRTPQWVRLSEWLGRNHAVSVRLDLIAYFDQVLVGIIEVDGNQCALRASS